MIRNERSLNGPTRTGRIAALLLAITLLLSLGAAAANNAVVRIDGNVGTIAQRAARSTPAVSVRVARTDFTAAASRLTSNDNCSGGRQCQVSYLLSPY
ncbi:MAG: hypothetical protein WDA15_03710 [Trueperaceae bacterium]